ncbi:MAG TPA: SET domain-containing protein-lysine N-methyltransferase [Methylomirabilota bacterium]|nr:SET domain-containing protein-lysine N-methyltransferase [Methylomirabilota bacterium]
MNTDVEQLWEARSSTIHGTGVFARANISGEMRIIEYLGERLNKEESERRRKEGNFFVFIVTDEFDLDGLVDWNPARFINHSCGPNCEAREEDGHIWVYALRDIRAGEELTFNYGYDLQDYEDHPCRCGAPECIGYMVAEEHFDDVRRKEAGKG